MKGKNPEAHPAVVLRPADDCHCSLHHFELGGGEAEDFRFRLAPWGELLVKLGLGSEALLLAGQPGFSDQLTWANLLDLSLELAELEAEGQAIVGPWDSNTRPSQQP
jgi:hypothetical protein